MQKLDVSVKY